MAELKIPVERTVIALENKRDVNLTMPWFASKSKYPPRAANVVQPLINGQRAFEAVHKAINAATKSIDIISWGLDPSMRLLRPNGERLGTLLEQRARAGVSVRMLAWKNALANLKENNIIGDGLAGSGGGSAGAGSGMGSTAPGNAGAQGTDGFNGYGSARSGSNSGAVQFDDPEARAYNRGWFAKSTPNLSFRTRDFGLIDRESIALSQISKRGLGGVKQRVALKLFPSHHQKMLLIDYELPDQAVGFVMGHNLLRDYWDTDTHEYESALRLGFAPWQDLSSRVYGPVLFDLNDNFCTAWARARSRGSAAISRSAPRGSRSSLSSSKPRRPNTARGRWRKSAALSHRTTISPFSSRTSWRSATRAPTSTSRINISATPNWRCSFEQCGAS